MMRGGRMWVGWVLVAMAFSLTVPYAQESPDPEKIDWDEVKRSWDRLSATERARYDRLSLELGQRRASGSRGPAKTPGEDCGTAEFEITELPFITSDSTIGHFDTLALSDFGACAGGGSQFAATGSGPDLVYKLQTSVDCELNVTMTPVENDLSLYVITDCQFPAVNCVRVSDGGGRGDAEVIRFASLAEETYFVWVDGFAGASDDFSLVVSESTSTGCTLVPVELQSFTVD